MKKLMYFLTMMLLPFLVGCARSIEWEEEVLLNTGEVISVYRSMPWELRGGMGNPFDIDYRPRVSLQTLRFTYRGRMYEYRGGAAVQLIAIAADGRPNLVATAASWAWAKKNKYYCVTPFYVQFVPDESGVNWSWPPKIESWLYDQPYNLMAEFPRLEEKRQLRYSIADREKRDKAHGIQFPPGVRIKKDYKEQCIAAPSAAQSIK